MSKPSRKRHPDWPGFRRSWSSSKVGGAYGPRFDLVGHGDAPLTPRQAYIWRWVVLGVLAICVVAFLLLGRR